MENHKNWSEAIALRITDDMDLQKEFPEDIAILQKILYTLFLQNEWAILPLIGTGIIEEDYFEPLQ